MEVGERIDPASLVRQRWFAAPSRPLRSITVADRFDFAGGGRLAILRVDVEDGPVLWCSMPITTEDGRGPWIDLLELATRGGTVMGAAGSKLIGVPPPAGPQGP